MDAGTINTSDVDKKTDTDMVPGKSYWNDFYSQWALDVPSQFCVQMAVELEPNAVLVEFGCGNGRDTCYLAKQGFPLVAMDFCEQAVANGNAKLEKLEIRHADVAVGDVTCDADVQSALRRAREKLGGSSTGLTVYSRFLLHSLTADQETQFLTALAVHMQCGEKVYFEFRCSEDAATSKVYGHHFRRYIDSQLFSEQMQTTYGFDIDYQITGQGLAKYKSEDPFITRIIAVKR